MKQVAVAIDGPSGAGKSTIARAAAARLHYLYVDTGAMYRAIGLAVRRRGIAGTDTAAILAVLPEIHITLTYRDGTQHILLCGEDVSEAIRTQEIAQYASLVSAIPAVRQFLLELQRNLAKQHSVLMDGRDIGTVVLPDAAVKIYLTASVETRAQRRYQELLARGQEASFETVLAEIQARDRQDMTRPVAPLRQAADAVLLDTSHMDLEQSLAAVLQIISNQTQRGA